MQGGTDRLNRMWRLYHSTSAENFSDGRRFDRAHSLFAVNSGQRAHAQVRALCSSSCDGVSIANATLQEFGATLLGDVGTEQKNKVRLAIQWGILVLAAIAIWAFAKK